MNTVAVNVPENLYKGVVMLARKGWFRDEKEIVSEAIRRFIESHQPELLEQHVRDDIEWGLHGED